MSHRVLVVEDERTKRTVLVDTLTAAGFEVAGAADGPTGMAMITPTVTPRSCSTASGMPTPMKR